MAQPHLPASCRCFCLLGCLAFRLALPLLAGLALLFLPGGPALAQPLPPGHGGAKVDTPAPTSGAAGVGIHINLTGLLGALAAPGPGQVAAGAQINTEWPDADTASARYSLPPEQALQPSDDPVCEPGELLVLWPSAAAGHQGLQTLRERDGLRPSAGADLPALGAVIARYQLADNAAALALRTRLRARHPDWFVDLNARASAAAELAAGAAAGPATGAAASPRLYTLAQLRSAAAVPAGSAPVSLPLVTSGVRVGVIDGPTTAQADLATSGFAASSMLWPGEQPASTHHGNAVARLIAARPRNNGFAGAAPGVALHWASVTRLVQGRERSNTLAQVMALDWLLGQGVHLINISMGGATDLVLATAVRWVTARPVLVLAAVGNGGPAAAPVYPAAYPGVLAVTATDALARVYAGANQGPQVALAAPGVDVWLPLDGEAGAAGSGQYLSGTSLATALATGMLAHWGPGRLRQAHADQLAPVCLAAQDLGAPGKDPVFGCGLVR